LSQSSHPTWFFAPLGGGEESGLNESGIEAFKRSDSLGRETCQNILDHADDSGHPCVATFELLDLPRQDFPGADEYVAVLDACKDHVLKLLPNGTGNERRFFDTGLELLSKPTIPTLRIGDENTTGLEGDDNDRSQPFWRLLKGQGWSSQEGVGGGTYGIGQRAPFARSALRAVIYSTKLASGGEAFIAKAILASHPSPFLEGRGMTQSKGWYCHRPNGGEWRAVRDPAEFPERYRRAAVGTDLYVAGYVEQDWEQTVRQSVLQNFFSAIDRGLLEVQLRSNGVLLDQINRENLEAKLVAAADQARRSQTKDEYRKGLGATLYYLKALRNPLNGVPFSRKIANIGTAKLFVHRDMRDPEVPERWAAMRRPMMVVQEHGSGLLSRFAAVLVVDEDTGNELLAQMEDPRHSRWHEEEARNWTAAERKNGRDVRLALEGFVKQTLKEIRVHGMPPSQDVPLLGRYLPLDPDPEQDAAPGTATVPTGGATDEETGHRITKPANAAVVGTARRSQRPHIAIVADGSTGSASEDEGDMSASDAPTEGGGVGTQLGGGGVGVGGGAGGNAAGAGGGRGQGHEGTGGSRVGSDDPSTKGSLGTGTTLGGKLAPTPGRSAGNADPGKLLTTTEVRFRSYVEGGHYCVIVESKRDIAGDLEFRAVGEDSSYSLQLVSAYDAVSGTPLVVAGTRVVGVVLKAGKARRLNVKVHADLAVCLGLGR
jgi:hypothetical protein